MAYINISSDGNRLVGPLGLKKAEQDLIKRRYKYQHYHQVPQDPLSRVAYVYGQPQYGGGPSGAGPLYSNQNGYSNAAQNIISSSMGSQNSQNSNYYAGGPSPTGQYVPGSGG